MIPEGHTPVDAAEAARLHGISLATANRRGLLTAPGFPAPLTPGRNNRLWDRAQVIAHATGQPIPAQPPEQPGDLLTREECAARWGITAASFTSASHRGYAPGPDAEEHGHELWRRATLDAFPRPGRGAGAGRPKGATDARPRKPSARDTQHRERLAMVRQMLTDAGEQGQQEPAAPAVAVQAGVSTRTAERLLAKARQALTAKR